MIQTKPRDPLLAAAKTMIVLIQLLAIFAMVVISIGAGALLTVQREGLLAKIAEVGAPPLAYWAVIAGFALIVGMLWQFYRFLRDLLQIVRSVETGNPFDPVNADLLTRMGWTTLGIQITGMVIAVVAGWLEPYAHKSGTTLQVGFGGGAGGFLLMIVLFILARVFRHGAAMREELEGTV